MYLTYLLPLLVSPAVRGQRRQFIQEMIDGLKYKPVNSVSPSFNGDIQFDLIGTGGLPLQGPERGRNPSVEDVATGSISRFETSNYQPEPTPRPVRSPPKRDDQAALPFLDDHAGLKPFTSEDFHLDHEPPPKKDYPKREKKPIFRKKKPNNKYKPEKYEDSSADKYKPAKIPPFFEEEIRKPYHEEIGRPYPEDKYKPRPSRFSQPPPNFDSRPVRLEDKPPLPFNDIPPFGLSERPRRPGPGFNEGPPRLNGPSRFNDNGPPRFNDNGPPRFNDGGPPRFGGPQSFDGPRPNGPRGPFDSPRGNFNGPRGPFDERRRPAFDGPRRPNDGLRGGPFSEPPPVGFRRGPLIDSSYRKKRQPLLAVDGPKDSSSPVYSPGRRPANLPGGRRKVIKGEKRDKFKQPEIIYDSFKPSFSGSEKLKGDKDRPPTLEDSPPSPRPTAPPTPPAAPIPALPTFADPFQEGGEGKYKRPTSPPRRVTSGDEASGFFAGAQENFPDLTDFGMSWEPQKINKRTRRSALNNPFYYRDERPRYRRKRINQQRQRPLRGERRGERRAQGPAGFWDDADFDSDFFNGGGPAAFNSYEDFNQHSNSYIQHQQELSLLQQQLPQLQHQQHQQQHHRPQPQRPLREPEPTIYRSQQYQNTPTVYSAPAGAGDYYTTNSRKSYYNVEELVDNDILGSGNFDIVKGGTFYDPDEFQYIPNSNNLRPQGYDYYGNSSPFSNFKDFAEIKEKNKANSYKY